MSTEHRRCDRESGLDSHDVDPVAVPPSCSSLSPPAAVAREVAKALEAVPPAASTQEVVEALSAKTSELLAKAEEVALQT